MKLKCCFKLLEEEQLVRKAGGGGETYRRVVLVTKTKRIKQARVKRGETDRTRLRVQNEESKMRRRRR